MSKKYTDRYMEKITCMNKCIRVLRPKSCILTLIGGSVSVSISGTGSVSVSASGSVSGSVSVVRGIAVSG